MAINPALLISAPVLQDLLVDKTTGEPLTAGVVTFYADNSRTTLKNVYYQSGTPGAYTYITLPNPLTLSAAGTIVDPNGNDTLIFYYPVSETDNVTPELYYVTVYNSAGQVQFTRQNFPFVAESSSSNEISSLQNHIVNNVFWRNVGAVNATTLSNTTTINGATDYYTVVAPSQHDGFSLPDISFIKNVNGANDSITFTKFPFGTPAFPNEPTPEYYLNFICAGVQAGETTKGFLFPLSLHLETLNAVDSTITIWVQNLSAVATSTLSLSFLQFTGTGATAPSVFSLIGTIPVNAAWTKYTFSVTTPSTTGLSSATLGTGQDDALYLLVNVPLSVVCNINFTKPSFYIGDIVPTNEFATYDEIDAIINSPRTGDLRTSVNQFSPYGWVAMNDGTIGDVSSSSTARANADTWPLFNLLWGLFKQFDTGSNSNPLSQMYNSAGVAGNYGATAYADFNANNRLALTKMMGKVILGTVPLSNLLQPTYYETFTTAANVCTVATAVNFFNGMPLYLQNGGALPAGLAVGIIYYVTAFNGSTTFSLSTTFANAMAGTIITFGAGNGTAVYAPAGSVEGEYGHTQLVAELATHNHSISPPNSTIDGASDNTIGKGGGGSPTSILIGNTGSSTPFNVTQPGTFYNIYIKL